MTAELANSCRRRVILYNFEAPTADRRITSKFVYWTTVDFRPILPFHKRFQWILACTRTCHTHNCLAPIRHKPYLVLGHTRNCHTRSTRLRCTLLDFVVFHIRKRRKCIGLLRCNPLGSSYPADNCIGRTCCRRHALGTRSGCQRKTHRIRRRRIYASRGESISTIHARTSHGRDAHMGNCRSAPKRSPGHRWIRFGWSRLFGTRRPVQRGTRRQWSRLWSCKLRRILDLCIRWSSLARRDPRKRNNMWY